MLSVCLYFRVDAKEKPMKIPYYSNSIQSNQELGKQIGQNIDCHKSKKC